MITIIFKPRNEKEIVVQSKYLPIRQEYVILHKKTYLVEEVITNYDQDTVTIEIVEI